jgi:hypothetical protein
MAATLIGTNVLVYAYDRSEPKKQRRALDVVDGTTIGMYGGRWPGYSVELARPRHWLRYESKSVSGFHLQTPPNAWGTGK